ncbi:MAG: maltotransferase domain-containing protein [Waddliaceae bacterium]
MKSCGPERVVIQHIQPQVDGGKYPVKRTVGEIVEVTADIFVDGHDHINANLLWKKEGQEEWNRVVMTMINNDRWSACFTVREIGTYIFSIEAWVDHFETWQEDLKKKYNNGQDVEIEFKIGSSYLEDVIDHAKDRKEIFEWKKKLQEKHSIEKRVTLAEDPSLSLLMRECTRKINPTIYPKELRVVCSRNKALYSTWYEMFPRSFGNSGKHGTFRDCIRELPQIAKMGFDVLYFPPIHPIGHTNRKGKNNALVCEKGSPGCPWAIGSKEGGHDAVHPDLGTLEDFQMLVKEAGHLGISLAIDLAFQCSPDHPYVKKHPKWFKWRPDGTVQYAENPPKKYEDIIPFHFENEDWKALWEELKRVVLYWVDQGIKIFRVDNPHTKPCFFL